MFRRKSFTSSVVERSASKEAAPRRELTSASRSSCRQGDGDTDIELVDTTDLDQKTMPVQTPTILPPDNNRPVGKERKSLSGRGNKKRSQSSSRRTKAFASLEETSATAAALERRRKPRKKKVGKTSALTESDDPLRGMQSKDKKLHRSKQKILKDPKIKGEIDKLFKLIKKSKKPGDEDISLRDIEKTLLRAFPKRREARRKKAAASQIIKDTHALPRRKVTVHIGSTSSDSLETEQQSSLKKPRISRIFKKALSERSGAMPSIFNFDRVTSSTSANSLIIRENSTFRDNLPQPPKNAFSLWDCVGQAYPACSSEAPSNTGARQVRGALEGGDSVEVANQTLPEVSGKEGVVGEAIADTAHADVVAGCKNETEYRSNLFQKLFRKMRSSKSLSSGEPVDSRCVISASDTDTSTAAKISSCQLEEVASIPAAEDMMESSKVTMLVSMSSPNQESPVISAVHMPEPLSNCPTFTPPEAGSAYKAILHHDEKIPDKKESADGQPSSSIFGFLDVLGNAFYRTVSTFETHPITSQGVPSTQEIVSDLEVSVGPASPRDNESREDEAGHDQRAMSDESRDKPNGSSDVPVEERIPFSEDFDTPSTFELSGGTRNVPNTGSLAFVSGSGDHGHMTPPIQTQSEAIPNDGNSGAFRESYVLGYLLGSLAMQTENELPADGVEEPASAPVAADEELELIGLIAEQRQDASGTSLPPGELPCTGNNNTKEKEVANLHSTATLAKKKMFGAGRAKRNETKAQTLAKKAKAMRPWLRSSSIKTLPPLSENESSLPESQNSKSPSKTSSNDEASQKDNISGDTSNLLSTIPGQKTSAGRSLYYAAMPLEEILSMIKTHPPPRLAKGFLTYILASFAAQTRVVDRNGLCKGYARCISEKQAITDQSFGPEIADEMRLPTVNESVAYDDNLSEGLAEIGPYELALAPTSYSLGCFRLNCTPCSHHEPEAIQMPDEDLKAIISTVESSLAQLTNLPEKNSALSLVSDISLSSDETGSWSTDEDEWDDEDEDDFDSEEGTYISDIDADEDLSSEAFSDVADWMEFLAGSFESSSGSENSAFDRMASFDVTEWMLRE